MRLIIEEIRSGCDVDEKQLDLIVRARNKEMHDKDRNVAKRRLMGFYLAQKTAKSDVWKSWQVDDAIDDAVMKLLKSKPRRTASGVATITVLTKPWPCGSDCIYCPNDIRMPKSYMSDEPACQRAERNYFDPYLQVASRLHVLEDMGHVTDKVELIVLGGTFSDYPDSYRRWFTSEMFRALNDSSDESRIGAECARIRDIYASCGYESDPEALIELTRETQSKLDSHEITYNQAFDALSRCADVQVDRFEDMRGLSSFNNEDSAVALLNEQHTINESSAHRSVGLVFETRPDLINSTELAFLRSLGCTKVQMGIQSLDDAILKENGRNIDSSCIAAAFANLRAFGFKTHIHFMVNLLGADPEFDKDQFKRLIEDDRFKPDEMKLYPCALVQSAELMRSYEGGDWAPYAEDELIDVLSYAVSITPPYARISRMIRDISAKDIVVGNKKTNLRQMVEAHVSPAGRPQEMRMREIATDDIDEDELRLEEIRYSTATTDEAFIQFVREDDRLVGFCRLSLPKPDFNTAELSEFGISTNSAMIREVHVYGRVSKFHEAKEGAQHLGLGRRLIERAEGIAKQSGYSMINVISAIGTRNYYSSLGYESSGMYQAKDLT